MSGFSVSTDAIGAGEGHPCNTCRALFSTIDKAKDHYRGEWHVFNSKRRSGGLTPLSKDEFRKLGLGSKGSQSKSTPPSSSSSSSKPSAMSPPSPLKSSGVAGTAEVPLSWGGITANSADELRALATKIGVGGERMDGIIELAMARQEQQLAARAARAAVRREEIPAVEEDAEEMDQEEEEERVPPLGPNISIFDDKEFATVEECVEYMSTQFGFYLPDTAYLTDLEGLVGYLGEKVKLGGICLYCQKQLRGGQACQSHMKAKSHCKIAYAEGVDMDEFEDFYDFTASYEGLPLDENGDPIETVAQISPIGELILPDGRIAGHRAFKQYYKQYFAPQEEHPGVLAQQREELLRIGGQVQMEQHYDREDIVAMPDTQVMALLVKYHKEIRRNNMVQQRAKQRVEMVAKRKENRNRAQQQLSSQKTTEKIRDYHGMLM